MGLLDDLQGGGRPSLRGLVERDLDRQTRPLRDWLSRQNAPDPPEPSDPPHACDLPENQPTGDSVTTGAEIRNPETPGTDVVYEFFSGKRLETRERLGSHPELTDIWVVNEAAESYDSNDPWAEAVALTYRVGKDHKNYGITGRSMRSNHPLYCVGTRVGERVFEEHLIDMHPEFQNLVDSGFSDFRFVSFYSGAGIAVFNYLVTDGAKWDIKHENTADGTPSYAAIVIGEWSLNNGRLHSYDDYGNISYGAFGTYADFPRWMLLLGADTNQRTKLDGSGDTPRDSYMIELGIDRFNSGTYAPE